MAILAEECGEVVQRVGKVLRHGLGSVNPYNGVMNRESLEDELTDIMAVVDLLCRLDVLDWHRINDAMPPKFNRLARPGILHHTSLLKPHPCGICGSITFLQKGPPTSPRCLDEAACLKRATPGFIDTPQGF